MTIHRGINYAAFDATGIFTTAGTGYRENSAQVNPVNCDTDAAGMVTCSSTTSAAGQYNYIIECDTASAGTYTTQGLIIFTVLDDTPVATTD